MQGNPDTATESVERLAADTSPENVEAVSERLYFFHDDTATMVEGAEIIRALAAERDALLAVARAARDVREFGIIDGGGRWRRMAATLDSLPPGTLDQSEG